MIISLKTYGGIRLFLYLLAASAYGFSEKGKLLLYLCYFGCTAFDLLKYCSAANTKAKYVSLQYICLYALIVPDNYTCIASTIVCIFLSGQYSRKVTSLECLLIVWVFGHIIIGIEYVPNLFFTVFYWLLFIACVLCGKRLFSRFNYKESLHILKCFVLIEYIPVIIKAVFFAGFSNLDLDWVYGTFGMSQGVQLFFVMSLSAIVFLREYMHSGRKKELIWSLSALCLAILTGSIAITLLYMAAIMIHIIINVKWKEKIMGFSTVVLSVSLLIFSNDSWVKRDILGLFNVEYLLYRVKKLQTYIATFITIPKEDVLFSFWGEGLGRYSSRAAMTMTGEYLGAINMQEMSHYTSTYILPQFMECKKYNIGTVAMPFSEICTIAGELGIIGLILGVLVFAQCYIKSNKFQKLLLMIIFILCFYDNYLEFPKIAVMIIFSYYCMKEQKGDWKIV